MAMNINPSTSQSSTQVYQNNQGEVPRNARQDSTGDSATKSATRVEISQRARDLQAQQQKGQQETGEAERTADNERTEGGRNASRQEAPNAGQSDKATSAPSSLHVVA